MIRDLLRAPGRARALQRERDRLQRELERARAQGQRHEQRVAELTSTLERERARLAAVGRSLDERRRAALSPDVLRLVLTARAQEPALDAHTAAAAAAREERFLAASSAYRRLLEDEAERQQRLEQVHVDGIPWWMPLDPRLPERAERTVKQSFPYRVILQTREVAVGGVMLDLGGNIGRTSVTRALLGDVRAVYAAEPEPANYAALVQNVIAHGMRGIVLPDQVAVGAARGEVTLHQSRFMGGHRVLFKDISGTGHRVVQVPCWPVDGWMEHVGCDPRAVTFVKVDVQGSEIDVLRGAAGLLTRRQAAWQLEVDPGLLAKAGRSVAELIAAIEPHFTHMIDIGSPQPGPRLQPVSALAAGLAYLGAAQSKTDLLLIPGRA